MKHLIDEFTDYGNEYGDKVGNAETVPAQRYAAGKCSAYICAAGQLRHSTRAQDGPPTGEQLAKWGDWWIKYQHGSGYPYQVFCNATRVRGLLGHVVIMSSRPVDSDGLPCWHKLEGGE